MAKTKTQAQRVAKMIGMALMLASLQFAIGSVEMSSKFSVASFATNDETLQRAADALRYFMYVALLWTLACMIVLFSSYGWIGALSGFLANALIIAWIWGSYYHSFRLAVKRNKLVMPCLWSTPDSDTTSKRSGRDSDSTFFVVHQTNA
jgi:hypothetical protein